MLDVTSVDNRGSWEYGVAANFFFVTARRNKVVVQEVYSKNVLARQTLLSLFSMNDVFAEQ